MKASEHRVHRPITTTRVRKGVTFSEIRKTIPRQWVFVGNLLDVTDDLAVFVISMPAQGRRGFHIFMFDRLGAMDPNRLIQVGDKFYNNAKQATWAAIDHRNRLVAEIQEVTNGD